jgi:predicted transcriptional regulator
MEAVLTTVTLSVASRADVTDRALAALRGEPQGAHISFASVELLWRMLTRKRWELLKAMTGQGAMTIRAAARRVSRDIKAVHGDVHALLDAGVLERAEGRRVVFPYDAVHVDFVLRAA